VDEIETTEHDTRDNDPFEEFGGICPRCDQPLKRCSPSGQGRAACDECQTYWE
jgi:hypothetical protein